MSNLNELNAKEIGRRLRIARQNAGVRQEDAANAMGFSISTLVSMEKGTRRAKIEELQLLTKCYQTTVNGLFQSGAVHIDIVPRFRKAFYDDNCFRQEAIQTLNDLVRAEVELENILGIKAHYNYPQVRDINTGDVRLLAEEHAKELRNRLGIGFDPISDIFSLIEFDMGIRLYQRKLSKKSTIAGLFAYDPAVGACMFLNANHGLPHRMQTAAHELGHFFCNRGNPEVRLQFEKSRSRKEKYANAFGFAFTMPREKLVESHRKLAKVSDSVNRDHVAILSSQFRVTHEAYVRRLEELGEVPKGYWQLKKQIWGKHDKQSAESEDKEFSSNDLAKMDSELPIPLKLGLKAHSVWKREMMSEGQLSELLKLDRVELRNFLYQIDNEDWPKNTWNCISRHSVFRGHQPASGPEFGFRCQIFQATISHCDNLLKNIPKQTGLPYPSIYKIHCDKLTHTNARNHPSSAIPRNIRHFTIGLAVEK